MTKITLYQKKECEDCSTLMKYEAFSELLDNIRDVLETPDGKDLIHHAVAMMKKMKELEK